MTTTQLAPPIERRDFFSGRATIVGFPAATLAAAYAAGRSGGPLEGELLAQALAFHRSRGDLAAYLSEGADNDLVDWFCQGHRDFDAARVINGERMGSLSIAVTLERNVRRDGKWWGEWRTPIAMLWNIEERAALADESSVRDLLGMAQDDKPAEPPALAGPSNLLGLPGSAS